MEDKIKELTLLLMYITSFEEKVYGGLNITRAWKGYDFGTLGELDEKGYINAGKHGSKGVTITEDGIKYAEELRKKYGIWF